MPTQTSPRVSTSVPEKVEVCIGAIVVAGMLSTVAIWTYQCSTSTGPFRREYSGKIIDKRIAVFESEQGSSFAKELIVEDRSGRRFSVTVTQETYDRAKPGMWIRRTSKGIELLPNLEDGFDGD